MRSPAFTRSRQNARRVTGQNEGPEGEEDEEAYNSGQEISEEMNQFMQSAKIRFLSYNMPEDTFDVDVSKWSDIDDDEVNSVLLNEDEKKVKTDVWMEANKEYLEEQERKRKEAEDAPPTARKKRRIGQRKAPARAEPGQTASESTKNLLNIKKLSRKINYNVLDTLFDPDAPRPKVEPGHISFLPSAVNKASPAVTTVEVEGGEDQSDMMPIECEIVKEPGEEGTLPLAIRQRTTAVASADSKRTAIAASATAVVTNGTAQTGVEYDEEEEEDVEDDEDGPKLNAAAVLGYSEVTEDYEDFGDEYNDDD